MERRRLQQQRLKQQRFAVSQQDLTQAIARMRPARDHSTSILPSSSSSMETFSPPSVSQLIKSFETRTSSTPYQSAHDFLPFPIGTSSTRVHSPSFRTMPSRAEDNGSTSLPFLASNHGQKSPVLASTEDCRGESSPSSYYSTESTPIQRTKEIELDHALAELISLSNDADISSSISDVESNSISASIALLNRLLESFELDDDQRTFNDAEVTPVHMFCPMLSDNVCANCHQSFAGNEQIVNAAGEVWHTQCFVCAHCFQPFDHGLYFEHEDRKYCERDFQMLFAPCCAECQQSIVGRVIRALQKCFHPDCFRCSSCHVPLLEIGFLKSNGRAMCRDCHAKDKVKDSNLSHQICPTCRKKIDDPCLKYKGECHHAYHFQCSSCRIELDENAREVRGLLYCQPCHGELDLSVCAACRRLIDDRVVSALGQQWHVEHFCCARCAQPFRGSRHFEHKGLAYCETDYHFLFGSTCFVCNRIITEGAYTACNKKYCADHFTCCMCETKMNEKSKFFDVDATPVCKSCYGKLPLEVRKSLEQNQKKKTLASFLTTKSG